MIQHVTYIREYDWEVTLFYNAKPYDARYILRVLRQDGIGDGDYYDAKALLYNGVPNEGLTYNNPKKRVSIVVIGHVSDAWELIDTIEHEVRHLIQGICNANHIDPNSEEAAYLEGGFFKQVVKELVREIQNL